MKSINKLPQDIRLKIKTHELKISTLNSSELLEYSKDLRRLKNEIGTNVCDYLFKVIEQRKVIINKGSRVAECNIKRMIKEFDKRRVS